MRVLIQRVSEANVKVDGEVTGEIGVGLVVFVGIEEEDTHDDIDWLTRKIVLMRIMPDEEGVMNKCVQETKDDILVVSQFTLHASTKKGNRPSYIRAAKPETAELMYAAFIEMLEKDLQKPIATGLFGADMKVHLVNDGPVTIWLDSKNKE